MGVKYKTFTVEPRINTNRKKRKTGTTRLEVRKMMLERWKRCGKRISREEELLEMWSGRRMKVVGGETQI